jgi:hypothetical protein
MSRLRDTFPQCFGFGFLVVPFGVFGFDHFGRGETSVSLLSPAARLFGRLFCIGIDEPERLR